MNTNVSKYTVPYMDPMGCPTIWKTTHAVSHLVSHRTPRLETRARHGTQTSVFIGSFIPWIQERGASFDPQAVQRQEILMKKQKVQGKHICLRFCLIMFDVFFDQTHIYRKFLGWFMSGLTTLRLRIGMLMLSFKFSQSLNPAIHRLWNASPACLSSLDSGCWNDGIITRWCPPSYVCWFIIPLTSSIYLP